MSVELLKKQLKENSFSTIYVFYGEEDYLKEYYFNQLKNKVVGNSFKDFNYIVFEGKGHDLQRIKDSLESFPVMSDLKMVVMKDSEVLKSPKAAEKQFWEETLKDVPGYVCLVFFEREIDGRSKLMNIIKKQNSVIVDFKYLKSTDLINWVNREFAGYKKRIKKDDIIYLLENCDVGMTGIKNEIDKIVHYIGNKEIVERCDIDAVITKSAESRIFQMIDAIMEQKPELAFKLLNDMMVLKEPVPRILTLLSRHFSAILKVKLLLKEGVLSSRIATEMGMAPFIAKKYLEHTKYFSIEQIHYLLAECLSMDTDIKTGKADGWTLMETFMATINGKKF